MAAVRLPPLRLQGSAAVRLLHQQAGSQPGVIEVDDNKAVLVITPALVYDMKEEVNVLPADIVQAVHELQGAGRLQEGGLPLGVVYVLAIVPLAEVDHKHKYFFMADPSCRKNKTTVSCSK